MTLAILSMVLGGAVVFMVMDFVWLGTIMTGVYNAAYGTHIKLVNGMFQFKLLPALILYPIIAFGLWYFVLSNPSLSWGEVALRGALLGFVMYAVYNLTCASILADYPWNIVFIDTAWGTFAATVTALAMKGIQQFFA